MLFFILSHSLNGTLKRVCQRINFVCARTEVCYFSSLSEWTNVKGVSQSQRLQNIERKTNWYLQACLIQSSFAPLTLLTLMAHVSAQPSLNDLNTVRAMVENVKWVGPQHTISSIHTSWLLDWFRKTRCIIADCTVPSKILFAVYRPNLFLPFDMLASLTQITWCSEPLSPLIPVCCYC